jgi:hypothetical protein
MGEGTLCSGGSRGSPETGPPPISPPMPHHMGVLDYIRDGVIHEKVEAGGKWGGSVCDPSATPSTPVHTFYLNKHTQGK